MKKTFSTLLMAAGLLATTLFSSCSSDDDNNNNNGGVTATKEYKLYNYSDPTGPKEAGTVLFSQLADSTVSAQVTLNSGFRQGGTTYSSSIITSATTGDFLYCNLTGIDGGVGSSTTSPVRNASTNEAIKYRVLIGQTGYRIKVSVGSIIQAIGTIQ